MSDRFDPIGATPLEIRLAMLANGYTPIPINGKRPILDGWQNTQPLKEVIDRWGNAGPRTGMLTKTTPVLDIDIRNAEAAEIVEDIACAYLNGEILVRIGEAPKRAILMRTDTPFRKIVRKVTAPDGAEHKIEILGDGQQMAVAGIHPDTGQPFAWRAGKSPVNTPRDVLPLADDIETIVSLCAEELKTRLGWTETATLASSSTGASGADEYVPQKERFEHVEYGGRFSLNQDILERSMDRLDSGISVEDTIKELEAQSRAI
jgi:hypothetical protein